MRRFSQRNSLVTLNEINITPLLDLAFVLLIIFVITTPLLEQGLDLRLPSGGKADPPRDRDKIRTVDVAKNGLYYYKGNWMKVGQVERELVAATRAVPDLWVLIRADKETAFDHVFALIDRCQKNGIERYSFRAIPPQGQK